MGSVGVNTMRVDLHVHTTASDGKNTPVEMVAAAKRAGLGAIAVTDHNTLEGWKDLDINSDFVVVPGVELSTDKGHLLLIGLDEMPPCKELDLLMDWVKDNNVIPIPAHVYDLPLRQPMGELAFEQFDIVEAINGKTPTRLCKKAVKQAYRKKVKFVCNSDAHNVRGLGAFYNQIPGETLDDLLENLRKGNFEPRLKFPGRLDFLTKRLF